MPTDLTALRAQRETAEQRAERAEAERDVLRADHEANLTILTRLVMDLPTAAGFRGGCENCSEIFDLVVEEHQALRATLAAVRAIAEGPHTYNIRDRLLALLDGDAEDVYQECSNELDALIRHHGPEGDR